MVKFRFGITAWLIAVGLLLPLFSHAVIEEKSSIQGTLLDSASSPLRGIRIRLLDSFFLDQIAAAVTDENGKFELRDLMPGLYLLSLQAETAPALVKRVQVVSGVPTIIDIRTVLSEEELKQHNSWDKLKWTIRVAERNPLRQEQGPIVEPLGVDNSFDGFVAALRNFQQDNNIEGEVSYMSVDSFPGSDSGHQMTQFAVQGGLEGESTWSFNGNIFDGTRSSYMASGNFRHKIMDHRLGATFAANDLLLAQLPGPANQQRLQRFLNAPDTYEVLEQNKPWIMSVDIEDQWNLLQRLQLNYGTRIDHYGYLEDSVSYSPRFEASYSLSPELSLQTLHYRNESAPGNYYLQPDEVHPYIHDIALLPFNGDVRPETTRGYEAGIRYSDSGFDLTVQYHSERVSNKIATVDLSDSGTGQELPSSIRPFVVFNAEDLESHGLQVRATRQITPRLVARVGYEMNRAVPVYIVQKRSFSEMQLFFVSGDDQSQFHDLQAAVDASFPGTQTYISAGWNYSSGSPLVFGRKSSNRALSSVDLEVRQGIPVHVFSQAQLKLLLAVKNLLDQNGDQNGNADFERALVYGMPRVVAGGVLIHF